MAHKPLYSEQIVGFELLDVLAATSRRGTVLYTVIKNILTTGRVLQPTSGTVGEEGGAAQFTQFFGLEGDETGYTQMNANHLLLHKNSPWAFKGQAC